MFGKRIFDFVVSFVLLLIAMPVFILIALVIYLNDRGPILFVQERIGKGEIPFNIIKFRTMQVRDDQGDSTVTVDSDPRLIPGARVVRAFKIDEAPQIVNVLKGDMSLVGPRPTVRSDYLRMSEQQRRRFQVLPGITGLAQVSGNTSLNWHERIKFDLEYIDRRSMIFDIKILVKTVLMVVTGKAETHPPGESEWKD
jgi:lipopolysaccharide/colanic/teichoic acid biosynthesis glycosyltransferase